jgi:tRNA threonylcarbamoyladenosine biosynthesis protein TsaE
MERHAATAEDLRALAAALGRVAAAGDVVGLVGDLGAGKTTFVQGLSAGLDAGAATSPTFTLVHIYEGGRLPLFHVDLYRLDREEELEDVGLDDLFRQPGVVAVEWWDRFPAAQPAEHLEVRIEPAGDGRQVTAVGRGAAGTALHARWLAELGA